MGQPPGYIAKEENKVCHLKKAIDGLKQSPWAWFEKFNITISDIGFHSSHSDHFAFVRHTKSDIVALAVYVDILLTGSDSAGLLETKKYFKRHFMTKDMRRPEYFLGIEVVHQKYNTSFSTKVCSGSFGTRLLGCKPDSTPMEANVDVWFDDSHTFDDL